MPNFKNVYSTLSPFLCSRKKVTLVLMLWAFQFSLSSTTASICEKKFLKCFDLGPLHTRRFCTQYCDIAIKKMLIILRHRCQWLTKVKSWIKHKVCCVFKSLSGLVIEIFLPFIVILSAKLSIVYDVGLILSNLCVRASIELQLSILTSDYSERKKE